LHLCNVIFDFQFNLIFSFDYDKQKTYITILKLTKLKLIVNKKSSMEKTTLEQIPVMIQYLPVFIMIIVGLIVGLKFVVLSEYLGARRYTKEKETTYESGMVPVGTARERFTIKFYLVAMSFIVFDIEVVFMYPWAVNLRALGMQGLVAMSIFIVILLAGLYYEIKKGGVQWD
jgi:NADH-quinone oxidoreductase subunit A